jgi:hypothetical protein
MTPASTYAARRQNEHRLFSFLALLIVVEVWFGFARTYFLPGVFLAPLPNMLVHVHGAVFTLWIVLFITQTTLVAAGRTAWHRRLGVFGACVAAAIPVLGMLISIQNVVKYADPGSEGFAVRSFFFVAITMNLMFTVLMGCAIAYRKRPFIHKRLALIATLTIMEAAYDRWPVPVPWWDYHVTPLFCTYPVLLLLIAWDRWSTGKWQPVTLWVSAVVVVIQQIRSPIGHTAAWQSFAGWVHVHAQDFWMFHPYVTPTYY